MAAQNPLYTFVQPAGAPAWQRPDHLPRVTDILGCKPDHGDHQLAWRILNLHSKNNNSPARRPGARDFRKWCNDILQGIWEEEVVVQGTVQHRRVIEANRRVMSAMHTLAGIRRPGHPDWAPNMLVRIAPLRWNPTYQVTGCHDFPWSLNTTNWDQLVYVPAPHAAFKTHYENANPVDMEQEEPRKRRKWMPTRHMKADAKQRRDEDLRGDLACHGFRARPSFMFPDDKADEYKEVLDHTFHAVPVPRDEDSLWYSLSLIVERDFQSARLIKSALAEWFNDVLTGPRDDDQSADHRRRRARFRMYCQLLADSAACVDPADVDDWGTLNLMRCLHKNARDSGMPMEAGYHEMLHLVADFFGCEVITFTPPQGAPPLETAQTLELYMNSHPYDMKVYGRPSVMGHDSICPLSKVHQILLVTDASLRYFQPVMRTEPESSELDQVVQIDTDQFDTWERHAPMPWWPGYQRNAGNDGWTGDWDDDNRRVNFGHNDLMRFQVSEFSGGLTDRHGNQVAGPYWCYHTAGLRRSAFYVADTDTDDSGVRLQNPGVMLGWTAAEPAAGANPDPPLVRPLWEACVGRKNRRFKSKGHFEGVKRMAECHLGQHLMHSPTDGVGFLRVHATEYEDRVPSWYKRRRR